MDSGVQIAMQDDTTSSSRSEIQSQTHDSAYAVSITPAAMSAIDTSTSTSLSTRSSVSNSPSTASTISSSTSSSASTSSRNIAASPKLTSPFHKIVTATSASSKTQISTTPSSPAYSSIAPLSTSAPPSPRSFSNGSIVATTVGASAGILGLAALALFLVRRRRRPKPERKSMITLDSDASCGYGSDWPHDADRKETPSPVHGVPMGRVPPTDQLARTPSRPRTPEQIETLVIEHLARVYKPPVPPPPIIPLSLSPERNQELSHSVPREASLASLNTKELEGYHTQKRAELALRISTGFDRRNYGRSWHGGGIGGGRISAVELP